MSIFEAADIAAFTHHNTLPSGFSFADAVQSSLFAETGSVPGAAKVAIVKGAHYDPTERYPHVHLAMRLRPPRFWYDVVSPLAREEADRDAALEPGSITLLAYRREYDNGWRAAKRFPGMDRAETSAAFDDGFLDRLYGRPRWHMTYCNDHANCGLGA